MLFRSLAIFYALGMTLPERNWQAGLIGAAVGFALVRVIADVFLLVRGKVGMGMGDGKLLAVVGALMGWRGPVVALFLGAAVAVVVVVPAMLIRGRGGSDAEDGAADEPPPPLPWADRRTAILSLGFLTLVGVALRFEVVPLWIAAIVVIAAALADDFFGLTDPVAPPEGDQPVDDAFDDELTHGALPFGPFLAVAALFWLFAEPYVLFRLAH